MSVYSISSINVKDWDAYAEYMKLVPAVIKKYGGKYIAVSYTHLALPTTPYV